MSDQLAVLKLVTARLDAAGIKYMITGSIAAGLYGQPRMTRDIDIVAVLYPPHAARLSEQLGNEFLCDTAAIRAAIAGQGIFSVIHRDALQKVDVIVRDDRDYEVEKFERRRMAEVDGQPIWVITPEDLVLSTQRPAEGIPPVRDTTPEVDAVFTTLLAARSSSERLRMTCAMFDDAKALAVAGIRAANPGISAGDLRVQLFERLYLGDFDGDATSRIIAALRSEAQPSTL